MRLITFLCLLFLSLSASKKPKQLNSGSSESLNIDESDASDENKDNIASSSKHRRKPYFNNKGTLRRSFAVELSFLNSGSNAVCSPVSALLPLGKLILGAVGQTRNELIQVIGEKKKSAVAQCFKDLISKLQRLPGVKLDIASRVYVGEDTVILDKFGDCAKDIFNSAVEKVSFKDPSAAADEINGWVSRQTNGMIPLLLQPDQLSPGMSMVIVNAVYFKGKWQSPFTKIDIGDFFASAGTKKVQLMSQTISCRYTKSELLNAEIVEIPYEGEQANFIIVLPLEKVGLPLLLNQLKLAPDLLNKALKKLRIHEVQLTIPKFSVTMDLDLKDLYEKIGLKKMFSSESGLINIVKDQELNVSAAIQKAVIEVHERGTEAAAASVVTFVKLSGPMPPEVIFRADHPFLFYVAGKSEQLFAGIYSEP